jgi:biopolymer transport protein ExbB/TolQ
MVSECVGRACARAANDVHREMQRGLSGVAVVAATAVWLGFIGTCLGIHNSFPGGSWEKAALMAAEFDRLGDAMVPAAAGAFLAIFASCSYQYLRARPEQFHLEMETAALDLVNRLSHVHSCGH